MAGAPAPSNHIPAASLFLWLLIQVAALVLAAARVPLAAQYPSPAEFQAVRVMLAVQIAGLMMLFAALCRGAMATLAIGLCGIVMLIIAGALAAWPVERVMPTAGWLTLGVLCAGLWRGVLRSDRSRLIASAVATTYTFGGILVWYLAIDLGPGPARAASVLFGPLSGALESPERPPVFAWVLPLVLTAAAVLFLVWRRLIRKPMDQ